MGRPLDVVRVAPVSCCYSKLCTSFPSVRVGLSVGCYFPWLVSGHDQCLDVQRGHYPQPDR